MERTAGKGAEVPVVPDAAARRLEALARVVGAPARGGGLDGLLVTFAEGVLFGFGLEAAVRIGLTEAFEVGFMGEPLVRLRNEVDDTGHGDFMLIANGNDQILISLGGTKLVIDQKPAMANAHFGIDGDTINLERILADEIGSEVTPQEPSDAEIDEVLSMAVAGSLETEDDSEMEASE